VRYSSSIFIDFFLFLKETIDFFSFICENTFALTRSSTRVFVFPALATRNPLALTALFCLCFLLLLLTE